LTQASLAAALEVCTRRCKEMDAPLAERLATFASDVKSLAPQFADIVDRMVDRLQVAGAGSSAPSIGEEMPDFVLPDENGRLVSLTYLLLSRSVVIAFHRGHWCPYCRINADALAKIEPEVKKRRGRLLVITPELQRYNRLLKDEISAKFSILSDLDCGYALELNLAIKVNDEKRNAMTSAGWDISPFQDNDNWILPIPATFVINSDGLIKARFIDPDYRKRMDIDELIEGLNS
jgi:peroxiredoxin